MLAGPHGFAGVQNTGNARRPHSLKRGLEFLRRVADLRPAQPKGNDAVAVARNGPVSNPQSGFRADAARDVHDDAHAHAQFRLGPSAGAIHGIDLFVEAQPVEAILVVRRKCDLAVADVLRRLPGQKFTGNQLDVFRGAQAAGNGHVNFDEVVKVAEGVPLPQPLDRICR